MLVSTLRWASEGILLVAADAKATWSGATASVERQLRALAQVASVDPLASAQPQAPSGVEVLALRREGAPWSAVADAAADLRLLDGPAADVAFDLLRPDEEMRPLLFHLGVLGELLLSLERFGGRLRSLRPLAGGFAGPAFEWTSQEGETWDIWFEAGGAWNSRAYGREEPYRAAAVGSCGTYRPLGADVMMLSLDRRALVVECKYPTALGPEYVCRNGYLQAVTYAVEARELAPEVAALVVGPEGVVRRGTAQTAAGTVTVAPPSDIGSVLDSLLR